MPRHGFRACPHPNPAPGVVTWGSGDLRLGASFSRGVSQRGAWCGKDTYNPGRVTSLFVPRSQEDESNPTPHSLSRRISGQTQELPQKCRATGTHRCPCGSCASFALHPWWAFPGSEGLRCTPPPAALVRRPTTYRLASAVVPSGNGRKQWPSCQQWR